MTSYPAGAVPIDLQLDAEGFKINEPMEGAKLVNAPPTPFRDDRPGKR